MIYGDNPNKINEREDALGLKAYTYAPRINSIMQSGNLYVYGINNPVSFADYTGEAITLAVFATRFIIGVAIQAATDIIEYAYSDDPNKELFSSSAAEYIWAGVSNTFSFGFGNKIVNTIAEGFVSGLGSEIIRANELAISGENVQSPREVWTNIGVGILGDLIIPIPKNNNMFDEAFPITVKSKTSVVSTVSPINEVRDVAIGITEIIPKAYKNNIIKSTSQIINNKFSKNNMLRW